MLASCLQFIDMSAYYVLGKEHFTLSFAKHINDNDHLCNKKRVQNLAMMISKTLYLHICIVPLQQFCMQTTIEKS